MRPVGAEADRVGDFAGVLIDSHREVELAQRAHDRRMKIGNAARLEFHGAGRTVARADEEDLLNEIELELKCPVPMGNRRRRQTP